jgi:hypothetical protein
MWPASWPRQIHPSRSVHLRVHYSTVQTVQDQSHCHCHSHCYCLRTDVSRVPPSHSLCAIVVRSHEAQTQHRPVRSSSVQYGLFSYACQCVGSTSRYYGDFGADVAYMVMVMMPWLATSLFLGRTTIISAHHPPY